MTTIRVAHVATVDLTHRFLLLDQLRRQRDEGYDVTAISSPGPWVDDLRSEGIRFIPWTITRDWDPANDARALAELVRTVRRERFHVVHTHTPKGGVLGRVGARVAGVPCVVNTVHGFYATPDDSVRRRWPVLAAEWLAARCSDLELYQSGEDLGWARRTRIARRSRSLLLGNGVDLTRFDPAAVGPERAARIRSELGLPAEALVVGTVGRLVAEKGYRELFAAAAAVRRALPEVRFVAVGDPDRPKPDAITEAEQDSASKDVTFASWREDVRDLLGVFDIFVLPSWREGLPRSAIEAAAMGTPLVLTDIRGCREVVTDGLEGVLVPVRDPRALSDAILALARDPERRDRMGAAARARAVRRFDERRVIDLIDVQYRRLLSRRGFPAPAPEGVDETGSVRVRRALPGDAWSMSRMHRESMPTAFLPALGDRFLRRLYVALANDAEAVALVAEDRRGILGFAAGVPSVRSFYRRFILRHGAQASAAAIPALTRPGTLRRVRESLAYPGVAGDLPDPELLSIAVVPGARSRGVGRALVDGVVEGLRERGAEELKVVVGADNEPANAFYERVGFEHRARIAVHDGVASNVWTIRCRS
ncbi:MAG: GNAT family N-acetyltransferase [Actinobacteria bacterium]|nr:GNAT family N-acetyltransferase [Actinomycetota bacterium]